MAVLKKFKKPKKSKPIQRAKRKSVSIKIAPVIRRRRAGHPKDAPGQLHFDFESIEAKCETLEG